MKIDKKALFSWFKSKNKIIPGSIKSVKNIDFIELNPIEQKDKNSMAQNVRGVSKGYKLITQSKGNEITTNCIHINKNGSENISFSLTSKIDISKKIIYVENSLKINQDYLEIFLKIIIVIHFLKLKNYGEIKFSFSNKRDSKTSTSLLNLVKNRVFNEPNCYNSQNNDLTQGTHIFDPAKSEIVKTVITEISNNQE